LRADGSHSLGVHKPLDMLNGFSVSGLVAGSMLYTFVALHFTNPEHNNACITGAIRLHPFHCRRRQGDWRAVELSKEKGTVELLADTIVLELHHGPFRLVWGDDEGRDQVKLDAKAGRLDLVGKYDTSYGVYSLDEATGRLTRWASGPMTTIGSRAHRPSGAA
jgi:hypothetical protein